MKNIELQLLKTILLLGIFLNGVFLFGKTEKMKTDKNMKQECKSAKQYKDGIYHGKGKGYKGPIKVKVTVSEGIIKDIKITKHKEDNPKSAIKKIPAEIIKKQSVAEIDAVSGATYTSKAILRAVTKALNKAEKKK